MWELMKRFVLEEKAGGVIEDALAGEPFVGVRGVAPADEKVTAVDGVVAPVGDVMDEEVRFVGQEGWGGGFRGVAQRGGSGDVALEEVKVEGGVEFSTAAAVLMGEVEAAGVTEDLQDGERADVGWLELEGSLELEVAGAEPDPVAGAEAGGVFRMVPKEGAK